MTIFLLDFSAFRSWDKDEIPWIHQCVDYIPPPLQHMSIVFPSPPQSHFYWFPSTATDTTTKLLLFSLYHHHYIPTVFSPPPHFYYFPSTTFLSLSLHPHQQHHHISIVFPPPPIPPHFYCFPSNTTLVLFIRQTSYIDGPWVLFFNFALILAFTGLVLAFLASEVTSPIQKARPSSTCK